MPRNKYPEDENGAAPSTGDQRTSKLRGSKSEPGSDSGKDGEPRKSEGSRKRTKRKKSKTRDSNSKRRRSRERGSYLSSSSSEYDEDSYDSDSGSESEYSDSEDERRRRNRERRRREDEKKEKRRREKDKTRKRKRKEEDDKKKRKKKKDKKKEKGKKGAVTSSWGKFGIIRETDMWNKRPEFTAWLSEVKKVNLESLPNWEEKQLFKDFMEDHNTATFPSKKYYNLDSYYQRQIEKEMKKGFAKVVETERTVFNDEEIRRQELQRERDRRKEQEVEALKRSMHSGMAQAMKEQVQLQEEMAYQYKIGNFEAAAAIQRRLDPDVAP